MFAQHPQSPLLAQARAAFVDLPVWPYDPAYAFSAVVQHAPLQELSVPLGEGALAPTLLRRAGRVSLINAQHALGDLDVYWIEVYGGGLFLPFKDAGSATLSYGGGRYLLDTAKSADLGSEPGGLHLDFNFAYHPSCFYNPRNCPLAPPQNVLRGQVRAGERLSPAL